MKLSDAIVRMAARVEATRAGGAVDLARLSDGLVHVRRDGAIEVVLHASIPVGPDQLAELRAKGVEVVDSSSTLSAGGQAPTGLVQGWVPAEELVAVSSLAWVAAVTPPPYPTAGG